VTGGASGIGRALCEELGQRGAVVIAADINAEGAQKVASAITTDGGRGRATYLDTTQAGGIQELIDKTVSEHGRLDYMFNNAGISVGGEVRDMSLEHWRNVIDVNLLGVLYGTTKAYQVMIKQKFGHIVNTASAWGLTPAPLDASYCTSKHGVVGLSTSLRAEAADLGVKVSVVCPGLVQTEIWETSLILNAKREDALALIPLKMIKATRAAKAILLGVARNKAIIVFPLHARLMWWLYRIHPSILTPLNRKAVRDFRKIRSEP
jgi:NAD(P)-dependent dehydrogenase (short-subunit alcohol dehydrogenase family)